MSQIMAKFHEQRAITPEGMLELGKDILVLT